MSVAYDLEALAAARNVWCAAVGRCCARWKEGGVMANTEPLFSKLIDVLRENDIPSSEWPETFAIGFILASASAMERENEAAGFDETRGYIMEILDDVNAVLRKWRPGDDVDSEVQLLFYDDNLPKA